MPEEQDDIQTPNTTDELEACKKKCEEYLAGWQRAKADFVNYKRDEMKRYEDLARYASEDLMEELIGVLDNFDLGLRAMEKQGPVERGVYMIRTQIEDILKKRGLTRIPFSPGDSFDPAIHEAIAEGDPPAGGGTSPGTVIEELSPGYRLHDKVMRPARVKIVKSKEVK